MSKICSYCGTVNPDGNAYCPNCGKRFSDSYENDSSYEESDVEGCASDPIEDDDGAAPPAKRPKSGGSVVFIILIFVALVSAGVLVAMVFGDDLFPKKKEETTVPAATETTAPAAVTTVPAVTSAPLPANNIKAELCADGDTSFIGRVSTVTGSGLNIRSEPSASSRIATTAKQGTVLTITKISSGWGYTSYTDENGTAYSGWVSLDYIECLYGVNEGGAKVYAAATGDDTVGELSGGTQVRFIGVFGSRAYISYGENGGYLDIADVTSVYTAP